MELLWWFTITAPAELAIKHHGMFSSIESALSGYCAQPELT